MDPRLAELYGTNQPVDEGDLEKAAAAEFAEGLTEEGEMSLDGLTEDDLEALAQEVLAEGASDEGAEVEEPAEEGEVAFTEEEQEKLAETDFIGRAMAHAYVAELNEIEKTAKKYPKASKDAAKLYPGKKAIKGAEAGTKGLRGAANSARVGAKRAGNAVEKGERYLEGKVGAGLRSISGTKAGKFVGRHAATAGRHAATAGKHVLRNRGKYLAGLATAGAGYGAKKAMDKQASALDTLAEQRAMELIEAGEQGEVTQYDVLADAVEQRAAEILEANGYSIVEQE